jgi:hypothetical protein
LAASCGWRTTGEVARELAVRHVLDMHRAACAEGEVHYLLTSGEPPSAELLQRLASDGLVLVAPSAAKHDLATSRPLPAAGERSVTFWVASFDQTGEHHGKIEAGWIGPGEENARFRIALRRDGGRWEVGVTQALEETDGALGR